jgi:hypothetical protein
VQSHHPHTHDNLTTPRLSPLPAPTRPRTLTPLAKITLNPNETHKQPLGRGSRSRIRSKTPTTPGCLLAHSPPPLVPCPRPSCRAVAFGLPKTRAGASVRSLCTVDSVHPPYRHKSRPGLPSSLVHIFSPFFFALFRLSAPSPSSSLAPSTKKKVDKRRRCRGTKGGESRGMSIRLKRPTTTRTTTKTAYRTSPPANPPPDGACRQDGRRD